MTPAEILARAMSTMPDEAWHKASAQARRFWLDQAEALLAKIAPMIAAEALKDAVELCRDYGLSRADECAEAISQMIEKVVKQ